MESLRIAEITQQECEADETLCFMSMPIWKLIALNLLTFGLYAIVWYYKSWTKIKDNYKIQINVIMRTIFILFTCYGLFKIINKHLNRFFMSIPVICFAIFVIVGNFLCVSDDGIMGWIGFILYLIPPIIIQSRINQINKEHFPQAENSVWTWKTTWLLAVFWLIYLIGIVIYCVLAYSK